MKFWKEILQNLDKQIELEKLIIEELKAIREEIKGESWQEEYQRLKKEGLRK